MKTMKVGRVPEKKFVHLPMKQKKQRRRRVKRFHGDKIPTVDIGEKRERCVLLLGQGARSHVGMDLKGLKVIAWYPEKGEVGLASRLMPQMYWPLDSCAGFVCGIHVECLDEFFEWKFRVAVSNPASKYQAELPVLDISHLPAATSFAGLDLSTGHLRLKMTPPLHEGELFCVHLTTSCKGEHTVHSFNTRRWCWESSSSFSGEPIGNELVGDLLFRHRNLRSYDVASEKWTAIAGPEEGKPWDADFPMPERLSGCSYHRMFPFRYGKRIMAACTMMTCEFVLLELGEAGEGWKVVATADPSDFPSSSSTTLSPLLFSPVWPAVRGDLLVLPCNGFSRPLALNLNHRRWMQLPALLADSNLSLHCCCVYEP